MSAETRDTEPPLPVELSDEPLVGWRCWFVLPHELMLRPIYRRGLVWKPREALEAICPNDPHEPPADGCKCGIWTVCHPMLLDEIGWTSAPPDGVDKLSGIMVVGEVSLWGKIIQHERGWRASCAYPRHLYAFTDDPMIAETLRERYGVPVEWGPDAERLRRLLPTPEDAPEDAPAVSVPDALLAVVDAGLCPTPLRALAAQALEEQSAEFAIRPPARRDLARAKALGASERHMRALHRRASLLADAEIQALAGDVVSAARAMWVRLARWQRTRGQMLALQVRSRQEQRAALVEDLARGTNPRTGAPYALQTILSKRRWLEAVDQLIDDLATKIAPLVAVEIPTYRAWRALLFGLVPPHAVEEPEAPPADEEWRAWHQAAIRRQERLAEQERALVIAQQQLRREREAFAAQAEATRQELAGIRTALDGERAVLRADLAAGVRRDHGELLREVGELERRRRAALAFLEPYSSAPEATRQLLRLAPTLRREQPEWARVLKRRLRDAGITQNRIAQEAGVTAPTVCRVLSGRTKSRRILTTAEHLLTSHEAARGRRTDRRHR